MATAIAAATLTVGEHVMATVTCAGGESRAAYTFDQALFAGGGATMAARIDLSHDNFASVWASTTIPYSGAWKDKAGVTQTFADGLVTWDPPAVAGDQVRITAVIGAASFHTSGGTLTVQ